VIQRSPRLGGKKRRDGEVVALRHALEGVEVTLTAVAARRGADTLRDD
jgi:hypothetical protein